VSEWRLFPQYTIPAFTRPAFFARHPWVDPVCQRGHAERTDMVADLVAEVVEAYGVETVTDVGCGDGALLQKIHARVPVRAWGYDVGAQNIHVASTLRCVDARLADFTRDELEYGQLVVATEVVEHLVDPRGFIRSLPGALLVLSSPFDEDDRTHYEHHAWAWDEAGYAEMVEACGWTVKEQRRCDAGFQAVWAVRP
jgi:trans-aconitate methyltransferase